VFQLLKALWLQDISNLLEIKLILRVVSWHTQYIEIIPEAIKCNRPITASFNSGTFNWKYLHEC